jgi:hypothetical protein
MAEAAPFPTGHRHRLRALEMLLVSMRTRDPALRGSYERLSQAWLALAERRERLSEKDGARSRTPPATARASWPSVAAPRQDAQPAAKSPLPG